MRDYPGAEQNLRCKAHVLPLYSRESEAFESIRPRGS